MGTGSSYVGKMSDASKCNRTLPSSFDAAKNIAVKNDRLKSQNVVYICGYVLCIE